jgi:ABC-type multidrug transport system fused ATPase/permease subunit
MSPSDNLTFSQKALIFLLMFSSSLFEFVGISLVYPFIDIVFNLNAVPTKYFDSLYSVLDSLSLSESKFLIGCSILLLIFLKGAINAFYRYYLNLIIHKWIIKYRIETYNKIFKSNIIFISENLSRINNAITKQIDIAGGVLNTKYNIIQIILNTFILFILGFLISIKGFIFAIILGGILFLLFKITYSYSRKLGEKFTKHNENYFNLIREILDNFNYLKTTNSYKKFENSMKTQVKKISGSVVSFGLLTHTTKALTEPIILFALIAVFFVNINFLSINLASVILMYAVLIKIFSNVLSGVQRFQEYSNDMASVSYFANFFTNLEKNQISDNDSMNINKFDNLEFENVEIFMNKKKLFVIDNLKIKKNKSYLFFGKSGSGKTTFIKTMLGLHEDYSGKILINGTDLKKVNKSHFRSKIGYVSQEISTFNLSLRENIKFRNENITDDEIIELLKEFDLENIFPNGRVDLNLQINEMKSNLSGGERQRISFIREIVLEPKLLIFDEATSSLDDENVNKFIEFINKNKKNTSIIIISHQKNYLNKIDEAYEISNQKLNKIS